MAYLSRDDARALAGRVLGMSRAEQARVTINSGETGNTRFAANQVSTSGDVSDTTVTITSAFGRRVASSTTNMLDDASLRAAVQVSEQLAPCLPKTRSTWESWEPCPCPSATRCSRAPPTCRPRRVRARRPQ